MKKIKIYTRTGDQGQTSLFSGQRVPKNDRFIEALGNVDECNSALGVALSHLTSDDHYHKVKQQLNLIQHSLFDLGAAVATPRTQSSAKKIEKTRFSDQEVSLLEQWMDEMEEELPPLQTFILPGGHPTGAALHLARSICRRAERSIIPLSETTDVPDSVFIYLNRLSDYLFMAARYVNHLSKYPEALWQPHHA